MVAKDNRRIFLNHAQFGDIRTILFDGETYKNVPVQMSSLTQNDRKPSADDYATGIYKVAVVLHCIAADIGGIMPEQGMPIKIADPAHGGFAVRYRILSASDQMGLLRLELEAMDE